MRNPSKTYWFLVFVFVMATSVLLRSLFSTLITDGRVELVVPTMCMVIFIILGLVTLSLSRKKSGPTDTQNTNIKKTTQKDPDTQSQKNNGVGKAAWGIARILALLLIISLVIFWGYKSKDILILKLKSISTYLTHATQHKKSWIFSAERSHDERNWQPYEDYICVTAKIIKLDEENLEFVISRFNKVINKEITAHYIGTRMDTLGRRYSGMWTQGSVGDDYYIHREWWLDMINPDKFSGTVTSVEGIEYTVRLERR